MTKEHTLKAFSVKMRTITFRPEQKHITPLFNFAGTHGLFDASQNEILKAYIEDRTALSKIDVEGLCDLGMLDIDSTGNPICRYAPIRKLVNVINWTTKTCEICRKARQETTHLETILGKKLRPKEYGSLLVMAQKREIDQATIKSLQKDATFHKRELGRLNNELYQQKRKTLYNTEQPKIITSGKPKTANMIQIEKQENTIKSLKEKLRIATKKLEAWNTRQIPCPLKDVDVPIEECFTTCKKFIDCPFYGSVIFLA